MMFSQQIAAIALQAALVLATTTSAVEFRAGVAAVDVSPESLPAIVNGGFLRRDAVEVLDPLYAKAFVLDDGATRIALCVVDSCMMPRDLLDRAKAVASERTGIPTDRMLISATHTHSAPAAMGCLGCPADADYAAALPDKIARAIIDADSRLAPARIGWAVVDDRSHTQCRRWIYRADRMPSDPFGLPSVRANMHPGHRNPDTIGPSGPVDPALTVIALRTLDGAPLGVLANYSMHYYGSEAASADYFGRFARTFAELAGGGPEFVVAMSQGTSGDMQWMDYAAPSVERDLNAYADAVARVAFEAFESILDADPNPLAMSETTLTLRRRLPDDDRLAWARTVREQMAVEGPSSIAEVYALEQFHLIDDPERELKLQAIRIGDLGITAIPNEVYAISGLAIKAASPLPTTVTLELANGAEGYIPPPEQHALGGYTTWPARTASLEVGAEPLIVDAVLGLLEDVADRPRKPFAPQGGSFAESVIATDPRAFFRLDDLQGPDLDDALGGPPARIEPGIALALDGPPQPAFVEAPNEVNRAVRCAGGGMIAGHVDAEHPFSVAFWFRNDLPDDIRPRTGDLARIESDARDDSSVLLVAVGGTGEESRPGRLLAQIPGVPAITVIGRTELEVGRWTHVALTLIDGRLRVHLDGASVPEIDVTLSDRRFLGGTLSIGGRNGGDAPFEGMVDELILYDRALSAAEIASLVRFAEE